MSDDTTPTGPSDDEAAARAATKAAFERLKAKVMGQMEDPHPPSEQQLLQEQADLEREQAAERGDPTPTSKAGLGTNDPATTALSWWYQNLGGGPTEGEWQIGRVYYAEASDGTWVEVGRLPEAVQAQIWPRMQSEGKLFPQFESAASITGVELPPVPDTKQIRAKFPEIARWFAANEPVEQADVYGLEAAILAGDTDGLGMYTIERCNCGSVLISQDLYHVENPADEVLRITTAAEREAALLLAQAYRTEPEWEREDWEAYEHACGKDY